MSTPMVGRSTQLDALREAFADGRAGHPRIVVVRGEAGIGKTRLLAAFRRHVLLNTDAAPPVVLAAGPSVDTGTYGSPFAPLRRLLRDLYLGVGDAEFRAAAGSARTVARLALLLPELTPGSTTVPRVARDALTEAVECVVRNLSVGRHLVLVMEDLHWADRATLTLLGALATTLSGRHLTVVVSHRTHHLELGHPARSALAELERSRTVTGIPLEPLGDLEAAALVRRLDPGMAPGAAALVVARADGVPFLIEELTALRGGPLPETLRSIVLAPYHRLSGETRRAVDLLATLGSRVSHTEARSVQPGDDHRWEAALREAVGAHLLVADDSGYTFRHRLVHEAVCAGLLPGTRVNPVVSEPPASLPQLTTRELQVARLVTEGLTNRQIGQRLFISPKTASAHVSAILTKLGVTTRTAAASRYREHVRRSEERAAG